MIRHQHVLAIFVASVLLVDAGAASADIVQCTDAVGSVTFTDVACKTAADAARASGASETMSGNIKILSSTGNPHAVKQVHGAKRERESTRHRRSTLDMSTVRAAKVSLLAIDEASALIRQQALARRSARAKSGWTFW